MRTPCSTPYSRDATMLFLTAAAMSYKERKMVALITQAVGSFIKFYLLMLFIRVLLTWQGRTRVDELSRGGHGSAKARRVPFNMFFSLMPLVNQYQGVEPILILNLPFTGLPSHHQP